MERVRAQGRRVEDLRCARVRRLEDHGGSDARPLGLGPSRGAQTPAIAVLETGERAARRLQVVAARLGVLEKRGRDAAADDVDAGVLRAGRAAPIAKEARERRAGAQGERCALHVAIGVARGDGALGQRAGTRGRGVVHPCAAGRVRRVAGAERRADEQEAEGLHHRGVGSTRARDQPRTLPLRRRVRVAPAHRRSAHPGGSRQRARRRSASWATTSCRRASSRRL